MADDFDERDWGPAVTILSRQGWSRFLPHAGNDLVNILEAGAATRAAIAPQLGEVDEDLGWASPAWYEPDPDDEFTDQELRELDEQFGGFGAQSAEEANAEEAALRAAKVAAVDGYARGLGLGPVRTAADALAYLLAARVVVAQGEQEGAPEQVRYALNPSAPAPGEVLAISEEERATEERIAWRRPYERAAQDILATFDSRIPGPTQSRKTTLERLGREIGADAQAARGGVMCLLIDGDFTATIDVEHAKSHKVFELVVDWAVYATVRAVPRL